MSRSAPSFTNCTLCGRRMTVAGFARAAHWRKHCRDGLAYELHRTGGGFSYSLTNAGARLAERVRALDAEIAQARKALKEATGEQWTIQYGRLCDLERARDAGLTPDSDAGVGRG